MPCMSLFLEMHIDLRTSVWLTHFASQSSFQLTPLGKCRMFAHVGESR